MRNFFLTRAAPREYGEATEQKEEISMGCFYCDEHNEGREAIMFPVGEMKAGMLCLLYTSRCV